MSNISASDVANFMLSSEAVDILDYVSIEALSQFSSELKSIISSNAHKSSAPSSSTNKIKRNRKSKQGPSKPKRPVTSTKNQSKDVDFSAACITDIEINHAPSEHII